MAIPLTTQLLNWCMTGQAGNRLQKAKRAIFCVNFKGKPARVAVISEEIGNSSGLQAYSARAVEVIKQTLSQSRGDNPQASLPIEQALKAAVDQANTIILGLKSTQTQQEGGATVLVAAICEHELYVVHLGNIRAYLLHDQKLLPLTLDHTKAQELVGKGQLTPSDARKHVARFTILSWLGQQKIADSDSKLIDTEQSTTRQPKPKLLLKPGDTVLLCSSRIIDAFDDTQMQAVVGNCLPQTAADRLINRAGSSRENMQAVVLTDQPTLLQWLKLPLELLRRLLHFLWNIIRWPLLLLACYWIIATLLFPDQIAWLNQRWQSATPTATVGSTASSAITSLPQAMVSPTQPTAIAAALTTAATPPTSALQTTKGLTQSQISTPVPTATLAPTALPTRVPLPPTAPATRPVTPTVTSVVATPTNMPFAVTSCTPSDRAEGSQQTFTWEPNFDPKRGQAFQLVFWKEGQDAKTAGLGLDQPTTERKKYLDLDGLAPLPSLIGRLVPGEYRWGVLLIQLNPYQALDYADCGFRFTYRQQSKGEPKAHPTVDINSSHP